MFIRKVSIFIILFLSIALIVYANDIPNADIGIVLKETDNQIIFEKFSPSRKGEFNVLCPGDIIAEIDGVSTENLSLEDVKKKIIGEKDSRVFIKILRKSEYRNLLGIKKTTFIPLKATMIRKYEIDRDLPIQIFKHGDSYDVKMKQNDKDLLCNVVYRKENSQYIRKMTCKSSYKKGIDVKIPTETWIDLDKLIFNKYNEYSLWHDNPNPIVKAENELKLAKIKNPPPPKDGTVCSSPFIGKGVWKNGACVVDMTKGMTKQEKEDYFRAKDFEEEYENYLKYKDY
ncbi:MAG: hypothetical protein MJ237_00190 [bacterium]|nr:hypothetical protein [bacterium]